MRRTVTVAILLAVAIGLAGCGGSSSDSDGDGNSAKPAPSTAAPSKPATATTRTIRVDVVAGEVIAGEGRHTVPEGSRVVLVITSDMPDEVHLHGYDEKATLLAGKPSRIEFTADKPGVFEIELHESGLLLCELQVR